MIKSIGEFEVKSELGRGGMGRVYRAHDPRVDRDVAIKVLSNEGDPDLLGRFRSEAGTTAKLRHQNIVTVHAYGEQDGMPYLVMELLEGQDLGRVIRDGRSLSLLDKVQIMYQVAEGLSYAHQNNVIHRDIKPGNIMLLPDGTVKIMDFGIARVTGRDSTRRTQKGFFVGTISYMAPEQFKLGIDADHMVDIFAYGDVFYELITGEHPFHADDPGTLIFRITSVEPKPVRDLAPDCPEALGYIIHQLLTKDRDLRYQSLRDVAFDIEPVLFQLKHERAQQIIQEAQPLIEKGQMVEALAKAKEALEVSPVNREAQRLRNELQRELHAQAVRSKVSAWLAEADQMVAQRRFAEAIPILENALRLDKSDTVQARLDAVTRDQEKRQRAGQLLAEARREMQKGNLTAAHQRAFLASETDPENTDASRLAKRIQDELENKAREEAFREAMQSAAVRAADGNFDEALHILDLAGHEHGESPELGDARARILGLKADYEWKQRHKRFKDSLADARSLLSASKFEETQAAIDRVRSEFTDWSGLEEALSPLSNDLGRRVQEAEIARIVQRTSELTHQEKFAEARAELDGGLERYPGHSALLEAGDRVAQAKAARDRADTIARATENIDRLRQANLERALAAAQAAQREYREHAAFAEIVSEITRELQARQRRALMDDALRKAKSLLESDPFQAIEVLRAALGKIGPEPELESTLAAAGQAAAERVEQQAVDAVLARAQALRASQQLSRALQELERGANRYPHRKELAMAAGEVRADLDRVARAEKLLSVTKAIESALTARDWSKGLGLVDAARKEFGEQTRIEQLARDLSQSKRAQEIANLVASVRQRLSRDDTEGAAQQLSAQAQQFGSEAEFQALSAELGHRREYLKELDSARKLEHQLRYQEAEQVLRAAAQNPARDKRAEDLLRTVSKVRARAETEARKEQERKEAEARELARKEQERKEVEARELARKEQERKEVEARELARKEQERKEAEARELARKEQERKEAEARELARKEQERKEAEARELARKEQERKEVEARELARKEQERKEAEARELARKEQERKEAEARELARKEQERKEVEARELARKEQERKEVEARELARKEQERKAVEARELTRKEQERKEVEARELARKEQERKAVEARELARKEQERKEVEARELARKEQERKEAEARELARKEQERKEAEARELARKEQERKEVEARELARKEQERKEVEARELARKEQERKEVEARELARKEQERKEVEARELARKEQERKEVEARELARKEQERKEVEARELARKEQERKEVEGRELARKEQERKEVEARELARKEQERKEVEARELARKEQERKEAEARELARKEHERKEVEARELARKEQERKEVEARELARKEQERKEVEARELARQKRDLGRDKKKSQARDLARKEQERKDQERRDQERKEAESSELALRERDRLAHDTAHPQPEMDPEATRQYAAFRYPSAPVSDPERETSTVILPAPVVHRARRTPSTKQQEEIPLFEKGGPERKPSPIYRRPVVAVPASIAAVALGYFLLRPSSPSAPDVLRPSPAQVNMTYRAGSAQAPSAEVDFGKVAAPLRVSATVPWLSAETSSQSNLTKIIIRANTSGLRPASYDGELHVRSGVSGQTAANAAIPVHLIVTDATAPNLPNEKQTQTPPPLRVPTALQFDYRDGESMPRPKQIPLSKQQAAIVQTNLENPADAAWARIERAQQGLSVSVRPTGMSVGKHTAVLIVNVPGAVNSPQRVALSLDISSSLGNLILRSGQEQIRWTGELKAGEALTIQGATCSTGSLAAGELPASQIDPDVKGLPHLRIESRPSARNGFKLQLRNAGPEPVTGFTLFYRAVK